MLVVIQGSGFCNIDCSYCYLPDRTRRKRIAISTINRLCEHLGNISPAGDAVDVAWHAGEPLVLPPEFYEAAFAAFAPLEARGIAVAHAFQTNGTLIDARWVEFFLRNRPNIGLLAVSCGW